MNKKLILGAVLALVTCNLTAQTKVLFEKESKYHYIRVDEENGQRTMRFRRKGLEYDESRYDPSQPNIPVLSYTRLFFSAFLFRPDAKRVLMIGLGGGAVPRLIHHYMPDIQMDTVELDGAVLEAAEKHFNFKRDDKNTVRIGDGRVHVRIMLRQKVKYDIIMLDAFRGGYIPYHLTTKEFFQQVEGLLSENGIVAANMRPDFKIYDYHKRTMANVFPSLYTFGATGNKICVGMPRRTNVHKNEMMQNAIKLQSRHQFEFRLSAIVDEFQPEVDYETKGEIFTDDYAPANILRGIPRE
ncbi:MAG: fused MFS/spermidine synthase [Planctomycetota bacterium]|nr:fused MFS/spermidine synthase [Planctomycetota bacterium]MDA1140122.1 fused MFS/spermidine synthase [Planctomycetota bacterium]